MNDLNKDLAVAQIIALMTSYSFDTNQNTPEKLVQQWLNKYNVQWIYFATIEALYLGRYKSISIEQILSVWTRIGQPNTHFGGDFERVICRKLPRHLSVVNNVKKTEQSQQDDSATIEPEITENSVSDSAINSLNLEKKEDKILATPLLKHKMISPPFSQKSSKKSPVSSQENFVSEAKLDSRKIVSFRPLPDASGFFQKLKAFATSQNNK